MGEALELLKYTTDESDFLNIPICNLSLKSEEKSDLPIRQTISFLNLEAAIGASLASTIDTLELSSEHNGTESDLMFSRDIFKNDNNLQEEIKSCEKDVRPQQSLYLPEEYSKLMSRELSIGVVLMNCKSLPLNIIMSQVEKFGSLSYFVHEFHLWKGVVFFGYNDLRCSFQAFNNMKPNVQDVTADPIFIHYSPYLSSSAFCNGKISIQSLPAYIENTEIVRILLTYGDLKEFHRESDRVVAEFFDIDAAKSAVQIINTSLPWGPSVVSHHQPLDTEQTHQLAFLNDTLLKWRCSLVSSKPVQLIPSTNKDFNTHFDHSYISQVGWGARSPAAQEEKSSHFIPSHQPLPAYLFHPFHVSNSSPYGNIQSPFHLLTQSFSLHQFYKNGVEETTPSFTLNLVSAPEALKIPPSSRSIDARPIRRESPTAPSDSEFSLDLEKVVKGADLRTTLMIRNIPNKYTQQMLLSEINSEHEGSYDFFYLPIDFKNQCNVGYAFINFISPLSIAAFYRKFNGKRWSSFNSEKVCAVSYARIQGKSSMISRFQNSSLMEKDEQYRPLIFFSAGDKIGKEEPFPIGSKFRRVSTQYTVAASAS